MTGQAPSAEPHCECLKDNGVVSAERRRQENFPGFILQGVKKLVFAYRISIHSQALKMNPSLKGEF